MNIYEIYSGGDFIKTENTIEIRNSFDNSLVANTYIAGENELEVAIQKAEAVKKVMKNLSSYMKYEILSQIAKELEGNKLHIASILSKEACKPMKYAISEIGRSIQTFTIAAEESKRLPMEYISLDWTKTGDNKEGLIILL
jgi:glyceraldehyde-3-phosphate dehydrogenase (NADP+)